MDEKTVPTQAHRPTLLGLAALADAMGLKMLSNQLGKAHDLGSGLYAGGEVNAVSVRQALQVVAEAELVWKDAEACERAYHARGHGQNPVATRIKQAQGLLAVARNVLSTALAPNRSPG